MVALKREDVLSTLAAHREEWRARGVRSLAIFGSTARNQAAEASDVDILVEFEPDAHIGLFEFNHLEEALSNLLGRPVDLVTARALRKEMKETILREAVYAF